MNRIDCLTERQRDVYLLREKGMSGPAIARQLGITQNAVYQHLHHIERRLKQFDAYQDAKERNLEPISIPLTRGEAKLIVRALAEYRRRIQSTVVQNIKSDWLGRVPYEYQLTDMLAEKVIEALKKEASVKSESAPVQSECALVQSESKA